MCGSVPCGRGRCGVRRTILTVASLCLMAALCEQLLGGGRLFGALRMLLGLEILRAALELVEGLLRALG